jgi:hypothetical protein
MKQFIATAALWVAFIAPASARDVLVAVMDNGLGEKSIHKQMAQHDSCMDLIDNLKKSQKKDQKIQLTFVDSPYSGYVIEVHCILPDGSITGQNGKE